MCFVWKIFGKGGVLAWQSVGIHMKIKELNKYFKVLVCMRHSIQTCLFHLNIVLQAFAQYICSMQKIKLSTNILTKFCCITQTRAWNLVILSL